MDSLSNLLLYECCINTHLEKLSQQNDMLRLFFLLIFEQACNQKLTAYKRKLLNSNKSLYVFFKSIA